MIWIRKLRATIGPAPRIPLSSKYSVALFAAFCLSAAAPAHAAGPSFNCARASTADELAICSDRDLASLELTAVIAFEYARDNIDFERLRALARYYLRERRKCGGNKACIRGVLRTALEDYKTIARQALE